MKILTVSDQVEPLLYEPGSHKNFPGIDLIISCGDLPAEYLTYLVTVFGVPLFYIGGNHDGAYRFTPPQGCTDLHGVVVVHEGIRIMGLEGCHWYNGGPYQYTEKQMARLIWKTKLRIWWHKGVDIIITHAPPREVHEAKDTCHRGFECFGTLIRRYSPDYFIHGHIHTTFKNQDERKITINTTKVLNTFGYHIFDYTK